MHQKLAIENSVLLKKDVFVNLPMGFGKSLIYQALLLVNDYITIETFGGISLSLTVVVSLLVSLMEHQVNYLTIIGVSAVDISTQAEIECKSIKDLLVRVKIRKP